jgi:ech hydrogenase subunit D
LQQKSGETGMFKENQSSTIIDKKDLQPMTADLKNKGYRLVVITCVLGENFDIQYSFEKDYQFASLRVAIPKSDPVVPSITATYLAAFTYENELQDLFGLTVTDMALNFKGTFYKTAVKTPFAVPNPKLTQAAK